MVFGKGRIICIGVRYGTAFEKEKNQLKNLKEVVVRLEQNHFILLENQI